MMLAAWYETQGPADQVLVVGEMPKPEPGAGEVRIRVRASGVNLGDIKKRQGWLGSGMRYPRVIPHSDNAELDAVVIAQGGVIAAYASRDPDPRLPFWEMLFQNTVVRLLGSDDFPRPAKDQAANDINACLEDKRLRVEIATRFPLNQIAAAHNAVEHPSRPGRIVLTID